MSWARVQAAGWMGFSKISSQEEIIHNLAELLEICDDTELIEKAFLESVRQLTSAAR